MHSSMSFWFVLILFIKKISDKNLMCANYKLLKCSQFRVNVGFSSKLVNFPTFSYTLCIQNQYVSCLFCLIWWSVPFHIFITRKHKPLINLYVYIHYISNSRGNNIMISILFFISSCEIEHILFFVGLGFRHMQYLNMIEKGYRLDNCVRIISTKAPSYLSCVSTNLEPTYSW